MKQLFTIVLSVFILSGCMSRSAPPADVHQYGVKGGSSRGVIQVYEGDNLYHLSELYRVPMRALIEANRLKPPYVLQVGHRLTIPAPKTYQAKAGDSYASIAHLYDLSVSQLVKMNRAKPPYIIQPGQEIYLSGTTKVASNSYAKTQKTVKSSTVKTKTVQKIQKKTKIDTPPPRSSGKFSMPVQGKVVSKYGAKKGGLYNDGINIAAPKGTAVRSADNGVVAYDGSGLKGFGNLVLVKHDNGYMTAYAHLDKSLVKRGDVLKKGQTLGTVGSTGSVKSPQLHFEIRKNGKPINPTGHLG